MYTHARTHTHKKLTKKDCVFCTIFLHKKRKKYLQKILFFIIVFGMYTRLIDFIQDLRTIAQLRACDFLYNQSHNRAYTSAQNHDCTMARLIVCTHTRNQSINRAIVFCDKITKIKKEKKNGKNIFYKIAKYK